MQIFGLTVVLNWYTFEKQYQSQVFVIFALISVRLWNFKDGGSLKAMEEHGASEAQKNEFLTYEVLKI